MKYYKYRDENSLIGDGTTYIETEDGWHWRDVTIAGGAYLGSNIKYPHWGLTLIDDHGDYEDMVKDEPNPLELQEIATDEFEQIWSEHLARNEGRWRALKLAFPIGTALSGQLAAYYPHGIIVDFGDAALGLITHTDFRRLAGLGGFTVIKPISAEIAGYDEKYQWLILEKPKFD